ncbi:MAG: TolC family protein [Saprospiraceae bacterium]|nr:TolC family protein [Saprospiraceae bacterium]
MRYFLTLCGLYLGLTCADLASQTVDSTVLPFADFMHDVVVHHPLARVADLEVTMGDAQLLSARGAFDPRLGFGLNTKDFKDQNYYQLIQGELKVATNFGLEIGSGYERNRGDFLNDQNTVPQDGLWNLEFKLPLGQGLFIDKRRAQLQKAVLYQRSSQEKRILLLNKLLLDAGKTYWRWFEMHHTVIILRDALRLATERRDATRESAAQGDVPLIDTVEAQIQVQNRLVALQEAQLRYETARNDLSVFLWMDGENPLELLPSTIPPRRQDIAPMVSDLSRLDSLRANHPDLRIRTIETEQLEVERRLRRELLKPTLDLTYKPLASTAAGLTDIASGDHVLGVNFGIPLFLRKERGNLALASADLEQAQVDLNFQEESLRNQSLNWHLMTQNTLNQIEVVQNVVANYAILLQGERALFQNGESSLFLINSREVSFITAETKLLSLIAKNQTSDLSFEYATGFLYEKYRPI